MPWTIRLRGDYDALELRRLAKTSRDNRQIRRLLALAAVYDGMSRAGAAQIGGMDRQTLRDWALRFNAEGPAGLRERPRSGRRCRLSEAQMTELAEIVETGPDPATDGVVRWRRIDLKRVIEERFGVVYSERAISDLLARLAFSHISGRPQHPGQDERVIDGFKKLPAHAACPHSPFAQAQAPRDLVPGRGQARPKERPRPALGAQGQPAAPAGRPALRERLPVRRDLPAAGQGRRSHAAPRRHRHDAAPPR